MMSEPDLLGGTVDQPADPQREELRRRKLTEIIARPVDWRWRSRYAVGTLTGIFGEPETCKSTFDLMVMARTTTGETMPFEVERREPGTCVVLSLEDDVATTIKPRFIAAGGDPDRLIIIDSVWNPDTKRRVRQIELERDLERLREALQDTHAQHLTISPVSAYLGDKRNSWKDSDVRAIIDPLQDMAASLGLTGSLIFHPNKNTQQKATYRMSGSQGFYNACRVILVTGLDPQDPEQEQLVIVGQKCSIGTKAHPLAFGKIVKTYTIDDQAIEAVTLDFPLDQDLDRRVYTADYILTAPLGIEEAGALEEAIQFLTNRLGPAAERVPAKEIEKEAKAHLISKRTLERARKALKVRVEKSPEPNGGWLLWITPKDHPANRASRQL